MNEAVVAEKPAEQADRPKRDDAEELNTKIAKELRSRADACKRDRRNRYQEMKRNVELRMGRIATNFTGGVNIEDDVRTEINPDWALTKTKTANLYSQVPTVQATHENKAYGPAIAPFMKELNYQISEKRANVAVAMEEVLNDTVNAAGYGFIYVGYMALTDKAMMPVQETFMSPLGPVSTKGLNDDQLKKLEAAGLIKTSLQDRVVDYKFVMKRGSPVELLYPHEFLGSNFDDADFIGHSDAMPKAVAKNEFKLNDEDLKEIASTSVAKMDTVQGDNLKTDELIPGKFEVEKIKYDELFYWRHRVDPEEKSFSSIWRLVFVEGKEKPVIHEAWKGQKKLPNGKYVGATKYPVRVLTLTYITDNPLPPSDSSAGRPQVNDLRRSRSQMFQNRERSIPLRWFDVNRIDLAIQDQMMRGTVQGIIPVNGDGGRAFGEVARPSYPSEDFTFDQHTKSDLMELWQIGPNQMGTQGAKQTTGTANIVQQNFATRIGQERGRVAAFFLSCCEVLAGLMVLYSDFSILSNEEKQVMMKAWDQKTILHDLVLKIRPDSAIVLDTNARLDKLAKFLNLTVKSGFINPMPIIVEMAELSGLDPAEVVIQPQPKKPDEPTLSFRFTGKEDLQNPVVMGMLAKHNQAPSPEHLNAAKKILFAAQEPPSEQPEGAPGAVPPGAPGAPPPAPGGPAGGRPPAEPHVAPDAHAAWNLGSRVVKRSRDMA